MQLQFDLRTTSRDQVVAILRKFEKTHRVTTTALSNQMIQAELTPLNEPQFHPSTLQGEEQFATKVTEAVENINEGKSMAITGATFLGTKFREDLQKVKDKLNQTGSEMNAAMQELHSTAEQADTMVKQIKDETADLKAALGLNSNGGPA